MKRRLALALAVVSLIPLGAYAARSSTSATIDRGLDSGSAWNYRSNACEPVPAGPVDRIYVD